MCLQLYAFTCVEMSEPTTTMGNAATNTPNAKNESTKQMPIMMKASMPSGLQGNNFHGSIVMSQLSKSSFHEAI